MGTAKPSSAQLVEVEHHFINSHSVEEGFTAYDFFRASHELLAEIYTRNNTAFLVGGSGLFVDAVVNGFDDLPEIDASVRDELNRELDEQGLENMYAKLVQLDPVYARLVDAKNPRRVVRALEVSIGTGKPFSSFLGRSREKPKFNTCKIGLEIPRDVLYSRINDRVDEMMTNGLLEEVRGLVAYRNNSALRTVGYQELLNHLQGQLSLEESVELIKRNTRRYAKRQLTWFKKDTDTKWFQPSESNQILAYIQQAVDIKMSSD